MLWFEKITAAAMRKRHRESKINGASYGKLQATPRRLNANEISVQDQNIGLPIPLFQHFDNFLQGIWLKKTCFFQKSENCVLK